VVFFLTQRSWFVLATCLFVLILSAAHGSLISQVAASSSQYQTLLEDDFSHGLGKWTSVQGNWAIKDGELLGTSGSDAAMIVAGDRAWTDYVLSVSMRSLDDKTLVVLVRWQDAQNYYRIVLDNDRVEIWAKRSGVERLIYREASWGYSIPLKDWQEVKVKVFGEVPTIVAYVFNLPEITVKDLSDQPLVSGMIGLGVEAKSSSAVDDVKVETLHPDVSGPYSLLLLLVEYPDVKHTTSPDQIYESVFPTLNQYFTEVSYNQTWVVGHVTNEWKMLEKPSTYYDISSVTSPGWQKDRPLQFLKDAIAAWDEEIDYRQYDYVFVAGAGETVWGFAYMNYPIVKTNDGITIFSASGENERYDWNVYAHELGHIFGLPDLYSYEIAFKGPEDYREAAIYVGPWDLMSRSNDRPQIGAWGKIKLGWIPPQRVVELLPGQQVAVLLDPLEDSGAPIQAVIAYIDATTYFIIENRQPLGFDKVLPDKGVLVSYVDEGKYWRGNGPVVVQDANPGSGPRWQLPHPTFDIGPGKSSQFTNQTYDVGVALLDKSDASYMIAVGKQSMMDVAESSYSLLNEASAAIQKASDDTRLEGLDESKSLLEEAKREFSGGNYLRAHELAGQSKARAEAAKVPQSYLEGKDLLKEAESMLAEAKASNYQSQQAKGILAQAEERYENAKQAFATKTLSSFDEAVNDAKESIRLLNEAKQAEQEYQYQQTVIIVLVAIVAVVVVAIMYFLRKRRPK